MNTQIPVFLQLIFLIAFTAPVYLIANLAEKNSTEEKASSIFKWVSGFYVGYLIIIGLLSLHGVFDELSLPPRIVRFTTIPLLVFLVGFVFHTRAYKSILKATSAADLVRLHIFRLMGTFFIILLLIGQLPLTFALIAGMGDLITATSSRWVARRLEKKKKFALGTALVWNTFGLLDILVTSAMAMWFTKLSIDTGAPGVEVLATFPFSFIPAFAPATIIFLHLSIYRKLLIKKYH